MFSTETSKRTYYVLSNGIEAEPALEAGQRIRVQLVDAARCRGSYYAPACRGDKNQVLPRGAHPSASDTSAC